MQADINVDNLIPITKAEAIVALMDGGVFLYYNGHHYYKTTVNGAVEIYYLSSGPVPESVTYGTTLESDDRAAIEQYLSLTDSDGWYIHDFESVIRGRGFCPHEKLPLLKEADEHHRLKTGVSLLDKLMDEAPTEPGQIYALSSPNGAIRFAKKVLDDEECTISQIIYESARAMSNSIVPTVLGKAAYESKNITLYEWPSQIVEIIDMLNSKIIVIKDKEDAKALVETLQRKFDLDK